MRVNMPREFYMPKAADLTQVDAAGTDAAVYTYSANGVCYAIGFHGKAAKPDFHHRYSSAERRADAIARYIEARKATVECKAKRKAERLQPHTLKVGDILDSSWGYDQTNVDFYQVTRIVGPRTVEICKIGCSTVPGSEISHGMADHVVATPDQFIGEPMIKRTSNGNSVSLSSYRHASPWDGKPNYRSWYA